jgi:hypothetical protein
MRQSTEITDVVIARYVQGVFYQVKDELASVWNEAIERGLKQLRFNPHTQVWEMTDETMQSMRDALDHVMVRPLSLSNSAGLNTYFRGVDDRGTADEFRSIIKSIIRNLKMEAA